MKALGFCVSRDHALYMTRVFNDAGISAATVLGTTTTGDRDAAVQDLRDGRVQVVFTVDVFNEGVDVPAINTVLFLRPTESSTVFLQQLGARIAAGERQSGTDRTRLCRTSPEGVPLRPAIPGDDREHPGWA